MKLINKKTGEIETACPIYAQNCGEYDSLTELNAEWCDVEDDDLSKIIEWLDKGLEDEILPVSVNDFVEKLKAWKRLKDKGFRFLLDGETEMPMFVYSGINEEKCITSAEESKQCRDDIKFLFGGEDE